MVEPEMTMLNAKLMIRIKTQKLRLMIGYDKIMMIGSMND